MGESDTASQLEREVIFRWLTGHPQLLPDHPVDPNPLAHKKPIISITLYYTLLHPFRRGLNVINHVARDLLYG